MTKQPLKRCLPSMQSDTSITSLSSSSRSLIPTPSSSSSRRSTLRTPPPPAHQTEAFWSSPALLPIYAIGILALLTGHLWLLHGISYLILHRMQSILGAWFRYTCRDNPELHRNLAFLQSLARTLQRESEKIPHSAVRIAATWTAVSQAQQRGATVARRLVQSKQTRLRGAFLSELGHDRYG